MHEKLQDPPPPSPQYTRTRSFLSSSVRRSREIDSLLLDNRDDVLVLQSSNNGVSDMLQVTESVERTHRQDVIQSHSLASRVLDRGSVDHGEPVVVVESVRRRRHDERDGRT